MSDDRSLFVHSLAEFSRECVACVVAGSETDAEYTESGGVVCVVMGSETGAEHTESGGVACVVGSTGRSHPTESFKFHCRPTPLIARNARRRCVLRVHLRCAS